MHTTNVNDVGLVECTSSLLYVCEKYYYANNIIELTYITIANIQHPKIYFKIYLFKFTMQFTHTGILKLTPKSSFAMASWYDFFNKNIVNVVFSNQVFEAKNEIDIVLTQ